MNIFLKLLVIISIIFLNSCSKKEEKISMIQEKNQEINIISREIFQKQNIRERHIIDSAQIIDFVDFNSNTTTDLGSGSGMPGIVVAIILKNTKNNMKVHLYEKSYHKSSFLRQVVRKLKLDVQIFEKDIFKEENLISGSIIARAFKPLPIILELVEKSFKNYTNLIVFMGKNGKQLIEEAFKNCEFEYKEKKSLTSNDSFLINIKNITPKL